MKIKEIGSKAAKYLVQDPVLVTVREAYPLEMRPGYNNGPEEPNQGLKVSDETGTIRVYVGWRAEDNPQPYQVGDMLELCCVNGARGPSGVKVGISGKGEHYLSCRASSVRVAGTRRPAQQQDPGWMHEPAPAQQRTQARPAQQPQLPARRDTAWAVMVVATLTEQLYNALCDSDIKGVSPDALFEGARTQAMGLWISIDKGGLDFAAPRDDAEGVAPGLNWEVPDDDVSF